MDAVPHSQLAASRAVLEGSRPVLSGFFISLIVTLLNPKPDLGSFVGGFVASERRQPL